MFVENGLFNGRRAAKQIRNSLRAKVDVMRVKHNIVPGLAIVMVGDNEGSAIYVRNKMRFAEEVGFNTELFHYQEPNIDPEIIRQQIQVLNERPDINSIIVQLPLPETLDETELLNCIRAEKDVDALTIMNIGRLANRENRDIFVVPCTAEACIYILREIYEQESLEGKKVLLIGDSDIVGRPLLQLLMRQRMTVTVANRYTPDLTWECQHHEIIISASGHANLITADMVNKQHVIIDVGIIYQIDPLTKEKVIVGDVDCRNIVHKVRAITPVPGGVGPLTVAFVLQNTLNLCLQQHNIEVL